MREAKLPDDSLHPTSRAVFAAVASHPGAHARRVAQIVERPVSTARHHLERLARSGLVDVRAFGQHRAFFPRHAPTESARLAMHHLNRSVAAKVLCVLAAHGPQRRRDLVRRVGRSASTVSRHLKTLRDAGLVAHRDGSSPRYGLVRSVELRSLVRRYPGLWASCCPAHREPP